MQAEIEDVTQETLTTAVRAFQRATDALDEVVARRMGINRTDARCLDVLDEHGRMTAGELAAAAGLTTGAVTGVLDRLEKAGYVARTRDTEDRRRVFVAPTRKARQTVARYYGPLGEMGGPRLAEFTQRELHAVLRFLRIGAEIQERRAAELRA